MQNRILFKYIFALLAFFLSSCVHDDITDVTVRNSEESFTVEEARAFFENYVSTLAVTRSDVGSNSLIPGDFAVNWDDAMFSSRQNYHNIEFTINAEYSYYVVRSEFENGITHPYTVPAYQKLVSVKNSQRDRLSNYIMTIIPDKEYVSKFKNFNPQRFAIYGDHADFSGFIIYSTIASRSVPVQVTHYKSGRKILDYSIFKSETDASEIFAEMSQVLQELQIVQVKRSPITRSFGEDDFWGGELEEVVITPEEPWDGRGADGLTNEEWLEQSRPGNSGYEEPDTSEPIDEVPEPGGPEPPQNNPEDQKKLVSSNLPENMKPQKPNRCVSASMKFISDFYKGNIKEKDYIRAYKEKYKGNIKKDGVLVGKVESFVKDFFNTTPFSNFKNAIDNGHMVMVPIRAEVNPIVAYAYYMLKGTPPPVEGHNVIVVGYKSASELIIMDPLSGGQRTISSSEILTNSQHQYIYAIEIEGIKK